MNTDWRIKSDRNIESSTLLLKKDFPSSSVHCSYYSNIQLMLHILQSDFKKTETTIENESKIGSKENKGFHNWIKTFFLTEIKNREHNLPEEDKLARDFSNMHGKLKRLRIQADYKNKIIPKTKATKALIIAKSINDILKKRFKI